MKSTTRDRSLITRQFLCPIYGLFRSAMVNLKLDCFDTSYPQEWIQSMATLWVSFPILIIQFYFAIEIHKFETSIITSIIFSILTLIYECHLSCKYWLKFSSCNDDRYWYYFLFRIYDMSHRVLVIVVSLCTLGVIVVLIGGYVDFFVACIVTDLTDELSVLLIFWLIN